MWPFGISFCFSFLLVLFLPFSFILGQNITPTRSRIIFRHGRGRISTLGDENTRKALLWSTSRQYEEGKRRPAAGAGVIKAQTISQKLDHFDGTNGRTWKQTYWVNERYHEKGGPVFLYISGGAAEPYWIGGLGALPDWLVKAKKFKALCFYLEHRYYGDSRPTKTLSVASMRYMNTYQALSDIANFITNMTATYDLRNAPWILFGCSYAGSLASWARLKYPHLVSIAVASGAPLEARLDFSEYAEVVAKVLKTERHDCADNIRIATDTLESWLKDREHLREMKSMFRICEDEAFNPNDKLNVSVFFAHLAESIFNVVQYNGVNVGAEKDNLTISTICDIVANSALGDFVSRYAIIHRLILSAHEQPCLSINYDGLIESLRYIGYQDDWRQWSFQACNEFGFHPTSNSPYQPFGHRFDLEYYLKQCYDIFGFPIDKAAAQDNIDETLRQYGGKKTLFNRVIFTYGTHDPWYPLTASETFRSLKVIPIEGGSHCADFYTPDAATDTKAIKQARQEVDRLLKRWIESNSAGGQMLSYMLVFMSLFALCIFTVL